MIASRRGISGFIRQTGQCGVQDLTWLSARENGSVHDVPFALAVCRRVCTPGEGYEKGSLKAKAVTSNATIWFLVQSVADLDALNVLLLSGCRADNRPAEEGRIVAPACLMDF